MAALNSGRCSTPFTFLSVSRPAARTLLSGLCRLFSTVVRTRGLSSRSAGASRGGIDGYQVLVQEVGLILRDGSSRDSRVTVHEFWVSYFFQEDAGGGGVQMGKGGFDQRLGLRVEEGARG